MSSAETKSVLNTNQFVHIGAEILTLIGMVYYFRKKNNELVDHISKIYSHLNEYEESIQNLENGVKNIESYITSIPPMIEKLEQNFVTKEKEIPVKVHKKVNFSKAPILKPTKSPKKPIKEIRINEPIITTILEDEEESKMTDESDDDSDLDKEISEELKELA